jgi:hypothetical protein
MDDTKSPVLLRQERAPGPALGRAPGWALERAPGWAPGWALGLGRALGPALGPVQLLTLAALLEKGPVPGTLSEVLKVAAAAAVARWEGCSLVGIARTVRSFVPFVPA